MICGFERGDVQVYEVSKKWERISHIHKCHLYRVVHCEFFNYQEGKVDLYEALSVDSQGGIERLQYSIVNIFDKIMVNDRKETIFEKGKCVQVTQKQ
jgi:hypothetical protein